MDIYGSQQKQLSIKRQQNESRLNADRLLSTKLYRFDNEKKIRFQFYYHGPKPLDGYRLVFGLHGGGGCAPQVNQQQWNNHKHLYDGLLPQGTIWFVPRSAQQASDMWWKDYLPEFFITIIKAFISKDQVNPNKVFLTGFSAGGDGVYQTTSMITDLLAGAAMMAGHPNQADCYNFRNISFCIQVGQNDNSYDRANWGRVYMNKIAALRKQFSGFKQYSQIQRNVQHWMNKKEANMFGNFFNQVRNPYPEFIIFRQHPRYFKKTFYYLKFQSKHKGLIFVIRNQNTFEIFAQSQVQITLMLNRNFVDFEKQITVFYNNKQIFQGFVMSQQRLIQQTSNEFIDENFVFESQIICDPKGKSYTQSNLNISNKFNEKQHLSSGQKMQMKRNSTTNYENKNDPTLLLYDGQKSQNYNKDIWKQEKKRNHIFGDSGNTNQINGLNQHNQFQQKRNNQNSPNDISFKQRIKQSLKNMAIFQSSISQDKQLNVKFNKKGQLQQQIRNTNKIHDSTTNNRNNRNNNNFQTFLQSIQIQSCQDLCSIY